MPPNFIVLGSNHPDVVRLVVVAMVQTHDATRPSIMVVFRKTDDRKIVGRCAGQSSRTRASAARPLCGGLSIRSRMNRARRSSWRAANATGAPRMVRTMRCPVCWTGSARVPRPRCDRKDNGEGVTRRRTSDRRCTRLDPSELWGADQDQCERDRASGRALFL